MINLFNSFFSSNQSTINAQVHPGSKAGTPEPTDSSNESDRLCLSPVAQKLLKNFINVGSPNKTSEEADQSKFNSEQKTSTSFGKPELSQDQLKAIQELKSRDSHVKIHEGQHMAVAGAYAVGGPNYQFEVGPDGIAYAVGGEVQLDMSPIANNPEATIKKAEVIRAGALAPADPSGADLAVAASAAQMEAQARKSLAEKSENESPGGDSLKSMPSDKERNLKVAAYKNLLHSKQVGTWINKCA